MFALRFSARRECVNLSGLFSDVLDGRKSSVPGGGALNTASAEEDVCLYGLQSWPQAPENRSGSCRWVWVEAVGLTSP